MCWHDLNYLYCFYSVIHIYYFQYLYYSIYYKSFTECLTPRLIFKSQSTPYKLPPTLGSQCCLHRNSRDCSLARCFFTLQWVLWISMLSKPARFRRYAEVGDIPNGSGEEIFELYNIVYYCSPFQRLLPIDHPLLGLQPSKLRLHHSWPYISCSRRAKA